LQYLPDNLRQFSGGSMQTVSDLFLIVALATVVVLALKFLGV